MMCCGCGLCLVLTRKYKTKFELKLTYNRTPCINHTTCQNSFQILDQLPRIHRPQTPTQWTTTRWTLTIVQNYFYRFNVSCGAGAIVLLFPNEYVNVITCNARRHNPLMGCMVAKSVCVRLCLDKLAWFTCRQRVIWILTQVGESRWGIMGIKN